MDISIRNKDRKPFLYFEKKKKKKKIKDKLIIFHPPTSYLIYLLIMNLNEK